MEKLRVHVNLTVTDMCNCSGLFFIIILNHNLTDPRPIIVAIIAMMLFLLLMHTLLIVRTKLSKFSDDWHNFTK